MTHVTIKKSILEVLLEMANSHIEEIRSGLDDCGLYDPSENADFPTKEAAVADAQKALKGVDGLRVMVDASTGHLSDSDKCLLDRMVRDDRSGLPSLPRVVAHEYGWCIFLTGESEVLESQVDTLRSEGAGEGLLQLLAAGGRAGAYVLNLDADAEAIPGVALLEIGEEVKADEV